MGFHVPQQLNSELGITATPNKENRRLTKSFSPFAAWRRPSCCPHIWKSPDEGPSRGPRPQHTSELSTRSTLSWGSPGAAPTSPHTELCSDARDAPPGDRASCQHCSPRKAAQRVHWTQPSPPSAPDTSSTIHLCTCQMQTGASRRPRVTGSIHFKSPPGSWNTLGIVEMVVVLRCSGSSDKKKGLSACFEVL
jgi:hypothetical protein